MAVTAVMIMDPKTNNGYCPDVTGTALACLPVGRETKVNFRFTCFIW